MVEKEFGYAMVDQLIESTDLESNGIYTNVGTYDYREMHKLVHSLHQKTEISIPELMQAFGRHMHKIFTSGYGLFYTSCRDAFEFLESIENHIHVEVRKLYPDAELPSFQTRRIDNHTLEMIYSSKRQMGEFAKGLIKNAIEYYDQDASIEQELIDPDGSMVRFVIKMKRL